MELEVPEGTLLADGFEEAYLGVTDLQPGRPVCAVYDSLKCINILMGRDKMTFEDALDFFEFNVTGAYVGDRTPFFVNIPIKLRKTKGTKCKK